MKQLVVVIPLYKEILKQNEIVSVERTLEILDEYDICFVAPKSMNMKFYEKYVDAKVIRFPDKYFKSTDTYSKMLLRTDFYKKFAEYEYMLIAQTDTMILKRDRTVLDRIMKMDYDYVGAVWEPAYELYPLMTYGMSIVRRILKAKKCYIGNGGFCLRKINTTIRLLNDKRFASMTWKYPEDLFFGYYGSNDVSFYKNAPIEIANQLTMEKTALKELENGNKPFAVHAWELWIGEFSKIKQFMD